MAMFTVNEYFNGFSLTHNPTGKDHWLSDGVDAVFDENEDAVSPGTPGFCEKWAESFNANEGETLEAYFPELVEAD